jgi:hypothetical protein
MDRKHFSLEDLFKSLPIIYAMTIYLGYLRYYFFYTEFQIDIFNYLSINEILFSFISLFAPVFLILVMIIFYLDIFLSSYLINFLYFFHPKYKRKYLKIYKPFLFDHNRNRSRATHLITIENKKLLNRNNNRITRLKTLRNHAKLNGLITKIFFLITILIIYYLFIAIFYIDLDVFYNSTIFNIEILIAAIIISSLIGLYLINFSFFFSSSLRKFLTIFVSTTIISIAIIGVFYKTKALNRYLYPSHIEISFTYKDKSPPYNKESLTFIGMTADYIFLRNFQRKENYIFKIDDVTHLRIRKYP